MTGSIELKSIYIRGFREIDQIKVEFTDESYCVRRYNVHGTRWCKKPAPESIYDAVSWVLFGCDSSGREDVECESVSGIDTRVECVLTVSGELIRLCRGASKEVRKVVESKEQYNSIFSDGR